MFFTDPGKASENPIADLAGKILLAKKTMVELFGHRMKNINYILYQPFGSHIPDQNSPDTVACSTVQQSLPNVAEIQVFDLKM